MAVSRERGELPTLRRNVGRVRPARRDRLLAGRPAVTPADDGWTLRLCVAGCLAYDAGDDAQAATWWRSAHGAGDPQAALLLGTMQRLAARTDEAETWFRRAVLGGEPAGYVGLRDLAVDRGDLAAERVWAARGCRAGLGEAVRPGRAGPPGGPGSSGLGSETEGEEAAEQDQEPVAEHVDHLRPPYRSRWEAVGGAGEADSTV